MIFNFNCEDCIKQSVCKYADMEVPEILSKVNNKLNNEYCPPNLLFKVECIEFYEKKIN